METVLKAEVCNSSTDMARRHNREPKIRDNFLCDPQYRRKPVTTSIDEIDAEKM